jgi:hypothetical protein
MGKRTLFLGLLVANVLSVAEAQTNKAQTSKVPCYSGDRYLSCTPAQRLAKAKALAMAKTAAVIIEAKQGIACGDGTDGCIRTDSQAIASIQREVEQSELWQNLTKADPKKADILLKFSTRDQTALQLCVYDADSNDILWCEFRDPLVSLESASSRELGHFIDAWRASQK